MENFYSVKFFHNSNKHYKVLRILIIIYCEKILTVIFLFLSTSILSANERDAQLDKLFNELKRIFHPPHQVLLNKFGLYGALIPQIKN